MLLAIKEPLIIVLLQLFRNLARRKLGRTVCVCVCVCGGGGKKEVGGGGR